MKTKTIILLAAILLLAGCKTKERIVYVPQVHTEYKTDYQRDSIYLKDSVYITQRGDTVWVNKYKYIYKNILKRDTLIRMDTVSVVQKVTEVKKVNELTAWQKLRLNIFNYLLCAIIGIIIYLLRKQIWKILKFVKLII